jgi:CHRD domain
MRKSRVAVVSGLVVAVAAAGIADLRLNQGQNEACFDISRADIDGQVFAGHIHVAPAGSRGPIVVTLFTGPFASTDAVSGCAENVDAALIKAIRHDPSAYYMTCTAGRASPAARYAARSATSSSSRERRSSQPPLDAVRCQPSQFSEHGTGRPSTSARTSRAPTRTAPALTKHERYPWVADRGRNFHLVIDTGTGTIVNRIQVTPGP